MYRDLRSQPIAGRCKGLRRAKKLFKWNKVPSNEKETKLMYDSLNLIAPFSDRIVIKIKQENQRQFADIIKSDDGKTIEIKNSGVDYLGNQIDFYAKMTLEKSQVKVEVPVAKAKYYKLFYFDVIDDDFPTVCKPKWPCYCYPLNGNEYCMTHAKQFERFATNINLRNFSAREIRKLREKGVMIKPVTIDDLYEKLCKDQFDRDILFTILSLKNQDSYKSLFDENHAKELLLYFLGAEAVTYFKKLSKGSKGSTREIILLMNEIGLIKLNKDVGKSYEEQFKELLGA